MAIDRDDERLLEALTTSIEQVGALEVSELSRGWVASASDLLVSTHEAFKALVEREDLEELEAHDALGGLRRARAELNRAFGDATAALDIRLGELRLAHDESSAEACRALAHFLNHYHGGEFESLRARKAKQVAAQAYELIRDHGASSLVGSRLERAIDGVERSREEAASEGAEAVTAYGDLVEGRSVARVCYLASRDLVSAALRFEGRHEDLDEVIPPIADVLVGFS